MRPHINQFPAAAGCRARGRGLSLGVVSVRASGAKLASPNEGN